MDQDRFDGISRALASAATRRSLSHAIAGGGLGTVLASAFGALEVEAKKKRKKSKRKQETPHAKVDANVTCQSNCADRSCGNDGCGGSCGACSGDQICRGGTCCVPEPRSATCGGRCGTWTNNCGQPVACSTCPAGQTCLSNGSCATVCDDNADCSGGGGTCGCSKPSVEVERHCISGAIQPFMPCEGTLDCPPGSHCQNIGFGGVCISVCR